MSKDKQSFQSEGIMEKGYGFIPKLIMKDKELTVEAKAIYAYLSSYTGAGNTAYPSISLMCGDLGISEARFYKHRKLLVGKGYVVITKQRSEGGWDNNIYTLPFKPYPQNLSTQNLSTQNLSTQNLSTQNVGTKSNSFKSNSFKSNSFKSNNKEYSAYFERVWSLYPNKIGKGRVSNTKKKEIFKLGEEFKRCIERYKEYVENQRINGFKELKYQNGSTFFNSGYVDYLDENYKEVADGNRKDPTKDNGEHREKSLNELIQEELDRQGRTEL